MFTTAFKNVANTSRLHLKYLTVNGVINGSSINIRDFLVETALAGPDFLYFGNQMVKIILIEDLAVDQPAFI